MSEIDVSGWSCDERNRKACRNGHGCHCREITVLRAALAAQRETGAHAPAGTERQAAIAEVVSYLESEGHGIPAEKVRAVFLSQEGHDV